MINENEHYLADWLADKLSDDQLQQLVSEDDFLAFQKIKRTLNNSAIFEPNMDQNFASIKQKLATKKTIKSRKVIPMWAYAVAACLLLSLGWYQIYFLSNEVATDFGATETLVLSDNSKVTINSKSKVCYANLFQYNRTVELEGEALDHAKTVWQQSCDAAIKTVQALDQLNVHKQIASRIVEPWNHITVLATATDYANFFSLRAHKDAQPEFIYLAELMLEAYNQSEPKLLKTGEWHLPFADKYIDGIRYMNCGDWVETGSVVVEYYDGSFELLTDLLDNSF